MAEALWLVTKEDMVTQTGVEVVNGLKAMVINNDDGDSEATTITGAETVAKAAGYPIPDGYFTTAILISDLTSGPLGADQAAYIFDINLHSGFVVV